MKGQHDQMEKVLEPERAKSNSITTTNFKLGELGPNR